ncbi:hypothetical protein MMC21_001439 [Puttea exsequens]|nr:hypothetical protein [Puttea exsequens]
MAYKRSRATFEVDLQAQQSPYVIYGTPLPPLDHDTRDDGSYVPAWKQEVLDEQGRKRLHGAFTGGFSAGYFNTVGSKEGWTPSTFVSSRSNRNKDAAPKQQKPEDFMDDEDLAEAEEAKKLETSETFAGFGSTGHERVENDSFMDVFKTMGETMGVKLLKKMGWREGQGIGPKVKRKAKVDEDHDMDDELGQQAHLFAPKNSQMISFVRKNDRKGLSFAGEVKLSETNLAADSNEHDAVGAGREGSEETVFGASTNGVKAKKIEPARQGAFGVGILNDDGSGDEDPYHMGPRISYTRVIGGDKKKKKKAEVNRPSANPLLNIKPVFISKKASAAKGSFGFRRGHDGRLPLDGYVLSSNSDPLSSIISQDGKYPPPAIPEGWKSSKARPNPAKSESAASSYQSPAVVAGASKLSPKSRAALLGESQLPGKSVFDFLTPGARDRIAFVTKNSNLPPALGEAAAQSHISQTRTLQSLVPLLDPDIAKTALGRGTTGWMPYSEDHSKRDRYRTFLEIRAGYRPEGTLPDRLAGSSNEDWIKEMNEFAQAAHIFKPMTGMMATRFTSSSAPKMTSDKLKSDSVVISDQKPQILSQPASKTKTPAEEAAAIGMYGPLTRSVEQWYPTRLLCKRFNVKPPDHVRVDPGDASAASGAGSDSTKGGPPPMQKRLELVGKSDMDHLRLSGGGMIPYQNIESREVEAGNADKDRRQREDAVRVDLERNEALEKERPGEAVFKAIFGSDSEDD